MIRLEQHDMLPGAMEALYLGFSLQSFGYKMLLKHCKQKTSHRPPIKAHKSKRLPKFMMQQGCLLLVTHLNHEGDIGSFNQKNGYESLRLQGQEITCWLQYRKVINY